MCLAQFRKELEFWYFFQLKEFLLFLKTIQTELANESKFRQLIVSFENKMKGLTQDGFKIKMILFRQFSHVQICFKQMNFFNSEFWVFLLLQNPASKANISVCILLVESFKLIAFFVLNKIFIAFIDFSGYELIISNDFSFFNKFKEHFTINYVVLFDFRSSDSFP